MKHPYETKSLVLTIEREKKLGDCYEVPTLFDLEEVTGFEQMTFADEKLTPGTYVCLKYAAHVCIIDTYAEFKKLMIDKGLIKFD